MPPRKLNKDGEQTSKDAKSSEPAVSEQEVCQESGKAANAALAAQKKAKELRDAATAAGNANERDRLTEEAINAEIEAESFGKTAKYLRSGTFQGMAMGTGLGVAPGATLGAITGTLVGGISSTLLGGLGAGIGGVTGALHGPFVNMGKVAGKGMQKLTGFLPEWAASEEQKRTLEKMVGQANEEEMPGTEELERLMKEGGGGQLDEGWLQNAKGIVSNQDVSDTAKQGAQATRSKSGPTHTDGSQGCKKPRKPNVQSKEDNKEEPNATTRPNTDVELSEGREDRSSHIADADERTKQLNQWEEGLNRREAELDKREKALEKHEKELESRSSGDA